MELKLKNVKFSEHMSEETNAFTADVYFNGKKFAYAKNDGHGGCTNVQPYGLEHKETFKLASEYALGLPEIVTYFTHGVGGEPYSFKSDLEAQVEELFTNWLEKREVTKNSNKGIYFKTPNGQHRLTSWKGLTINKMLKYPRGVETIKETVARHQKAGNTILNTNLGSILA